MTVSAEARAMLNDMAARDGLSVDDIVNHVITILERS